MNKVMNVQGYMKGELVVGFKEHLRLDRQHQ